MWPTTRPADTLQPDRRGRPAQLSIRIQENNLDTILALGQRTFGSAYRFVPPMSVTLGMKEILSARKSVFLRYRRLETDCPARGPVRPHDAEYPITPLQGHSDVLLTATVETARHLSANTRSGSRL
jgi:glucosamine-6-phosphate deaminase